VNDHLTRRRFAVLALVVALVAPALGLAIAVWLVPDSLLSVTPKTVPLTVPVTAVTDTEAQPIVGDLDWVSGTSLVAPNWTGTVTAVEAKSGSTIRTGSAIATIDGTEAIVAFSPFPFYRSIGPGVTGPDVAALGAVLISLGIADVRVSDTYDTALGDAINLLSQRLTGVAPAAGSQSIFEPSWFVWLPAKQIRVKAVALVVGEPAPAQGTTILTSPSQILSVTITPGTTAGGDIEPLPASARGYVVSFPGSPPYRLNSSFTVTDSSLLHSLDQLDQPSASTVGGMLELADPARFSSVPSSAVVVDATGRTCVFVPAGSGFAPVMVTTEAGLPGSTEVTGLARHDTAVLSNPASIFPARGCS
jgi:hypothetical protein